MMKRKLLLLILALGLFFRIYGWEKSFSFAHDQDLYSWIAKDIIYNGHIRAVGQITSVDGVFIGPLYYYAIALFYKLSGGNPDSAVILVTLISLATIYSFYFVVGKLYGERAGMIGGLIYAISAGTAFYDRWSVPTQPVPIWCIWYIYCTIKLYRGDKKAWVLYGLLVGLIWHIHIALLPLVPLPAIAYFLSKTRNKYNSDFIKKIALGLGFFVLIMSPGIYFELKSGFSQTKSIVIATKKVIQGTPIGIKKVEKTLDASGKHVRGILIPQLEILSPNTLWIFLIVIWVLSSRSIDKKEWLAFSVWIILIMLAQFTSKRPVSEYYFAALSPVFLVFCAINLSKINTVFLATIMIIYFIGSSNFFFKNLDSDGSYYYIKKVVSYIKNEVVKNNYPCISINYIAKFGDGVGFRYLFWYNGVKVVKHDPAVASFDIVIPGSISGNELDSQFGRYGIIKPKNRNKLSDDICNQGSQELDPLLGYVD